MSYQNLDQWKLARGHHEIPLVCAWSSTEHVGQGSFLGDSVGFHQ